MKMAFWASGRWRHLAPKIPTLSTQARVTSHLFPVPACSIMPRPLPLSGGGGHLTHAVIGAIEVGANGDLANWRMPGQKIPGVGGAMDIAYSVKNLYVAMTHVSNKGEPKIVTACTSPLTAPPLCAAHLHGSGSDRRHVRGLGAARGGARLGCHCRAGQDRSAIARGR